MSDVMLSTSDLIELKKFKCLWNRLLDLRQGLQLYRYFVWKYSNEILLIKANNSDFYNYNRPWYIHGFKSPESPHCSKFNGIEILTVFPELPHCVIDGYVGGFLNVIY